MPGEKLRIVMPAAGGGFLPRTRASLMCWRQMHRQIDRLAYAHTSFSPAMPVEAACQNITRTCARRQLNYAYFVSGGSEAVETALEDGAATLWRIG